MKHLLVGIRLRIGYVLARFLISTPDLNMKIVCSLGY